MRELNPIPFQNQNGEYFLAQRCKKVIRLGCGMCKLNSLFRTDPYIPLDELGDEKEKKTMINKQEKRTNQWFNFQFRTT